MSARGDGVLVWALATFHASAFVLVAVLLAYRAGGLGQALSGLNTAVGFALFIALWATTFRATRNALAGLEVAQPAPIDANAFMTRAFRWGALNGAAFLAVLAIVLLGGYALTHVDDFVSALTGPTVLQSAALLAGGLVIASAFALVIGGFAGLILSGLDLLLLGLAARLVAVHRIE